MHTVEFPTFKKFLPEDLSECTPQEYIDMCELILQYQTNTINFETFKIQSLYRLMNFKRSKKLSLESEKVLTNIKNLSDLIETFFDTNENQKTIKTDFIHNPVPVIKHFRTYKGPSDAFQNLSFGQYIDALRLMQDFGKTGDFDNLFLIAAILYLPKKIFSKNTLPYDGKTVEQRSKTFRFLPIGFIYGTFLWFASFQKWLTTAEVPFAGRELDFSIIYSGGENETEQIPSVGMDAIVFSIAESGVYGTKEQTLRADLWDVLIRIYDIRKRDLDKDYPKT
jgi:hypothetical protein